MTLDKIILRTATTAALIWTIAGGAELVTGHSGSAVVFAGIAVFALLIEAAWRFLSRASRG
jgi:hypothetical protein